MIRYSLRCEKDHEFETWFRSGADFDRLVGEDGVPCPVCGDTNVVKAPMAPAVARTDTERSVRPAKASPDEDKVQLAATPADPRERALRSAIRELRRKVAEHADYVGDRFAEEARKIHYNEVEPHGIWGEATIEEAEALVEEGVEVHPLPPVPEDGN